MLDAQKTLRELKALDDLEGRIRQTVNPSAILLAEIDKKRNALLKGEPSETVPPKSSK